MRLAFDKMVIGAVMNSNYSYDGQTMTTFKDVTEVLFSERIHGMLRSGRIGHVMGYVINWIYHPTMECEHGGWMVNAWNNYCCERDFHLCLGDLLKDDHKTGTHTALKLIKKTASNSPITLFKKMSM